MCIRDRRGQGLWLARYSCLFHGRGWLEMPLAALVLGQNDGSDVVPSAIEAHVPRHTCVFIGFVHDIMNPVPVGPRLLDGVDEQLCPIIAVSVSYTHLRAH